MRIGLQSWGTEGDLRPFLALGQAQDFIGRMAHYPAHARFKRVAFEEAFDGRRRAPWQREVGIASVLERWEDGRRGKNMVLEHELPARAARSGPVPESLAAPVREALTKRGITSLYTHQLEALSLAGDEHDFVVATPTAPGPMGASV